MTKLGKKLVSRDATEIIGTAEDITEPRQAGRNYAHSSVNFENSPIGKHSSRI
jgi:hypothetical protein